MNQQPALGRQIREMIEGFFWFPVPKCDLRLGSQVITGCSSKRGMKIFHEVIDLVRGFLTMFYSFMS